MRHFQKLICGVLAASIALSCLSMPALARTDDVPAKPAKISAADATLYKSLNGTWQGSFHTPLAATTYFDDPVELNFVNKSLSSKLFLTIESYDANYILPNQWSIKDGTLTFTFNEGTWLAEVVLCLDGDTTLTGSYSQYGRKYDLTLQKISDSPVVKDRESRFTFEEKPYEDWRDELRKYPDFGKGGASIPFTYELYAWNKSLPLLNAAAFADALNNTKGNDVDRMVALMNVLCNRFPHEGSSGMPEKLDAISVMQYAKSKGGIECRGLSTMLSEVLRASGIPAKPVMCIPYTDPCEDCHVVVHAYSSDLKQWIMLDPTYRLVLKDTDGNYLDIPSMRDALVSGEKLVANSNAGHNGMPFSMTFYRAYMTKNMFRFSSLTNSSFGAENDKNNRTQMLVPKSYRVPYAGSRPEVVTTSGEAFWAPPN